MCSGKHHIFYRECTEWGMVKIVVNSSLVLSLHRNHEWYKFKLVELSLNELCLLSLIPWFNFFYLSRYSRRLEQNPNPSCFCTWGGNQSTWRGQNMQISYRQAGNGTRSSGCKASTLTSHWSTECMQQINVVFRFAGFALCTLNYSVLHSLWQTKRKQLI